MNLPIIKEWALCLVNPVYAHNTKLRIDPVKQDRALTIIKHVVFFLLGACVVMFIWMIYQWHFYKDMIIIEYPDRTVYTKYKDGLDIQK